MGIARCRVTLRNKHRDPDKNLKDLINEFKYRVDDAKILNQLKEKQYYESKGIKKKRQKKESARKYKQSNLEERIMAGEPVNAPSGVINKIRSKNSKTKNR